VDTNQSPRSLLKTWPVSLDEHRRHALTTSRDQSNVAQNRPSPLAVVTVNAAVLYGALRGLLRRAQVYHLSRAGERVAATLSVGALELAALLRTRRAVRCGRLIPLRFSLTAGGGGLSKGDNMRFADVIMDMERAATAGTTAVGDFGAAFHTPHSFLTAAREEQARVLARLRWMQVPIEIGNKVYTFFYRDVLTAGLDALACAEAVDFG